jgi:biotin carboxyl carrier protein
MKNYKIKINGNNYSVDITAIQDNVAQVEVNGTLYEIELENLPKTSKTAKQVIKMATPPVPKAAPVTTKIDTPHVAPSSGSVIKSPLPGVVLDVFVNAGATVKAGQHLILLEAMKMENNIDADKDGVVKEVKVKRSDAVMEGDVLIIIE